MPAKKPRRLGRPPASSAVETRQRILVVARDAFAELGYERTTNKYLATEASITTGALYHYFDSKVEIYRAAHEWVLQSVYARFSESLRGVDGFVARLEAVLETAHDLNSEDPALARFIGAARVDAARHPEVGRALGRASEAGGSFFESLVDHGVGRGEIAPEKRALVLAFVRIVVVGLTDAVSHDAQRHRTAVDAVRAVIEGDLLPRPTSGGAPSRPRSGVRRVAGATVSRRGRAAGGRLPASN